MDRGGCELGWIYGVEGVACGCSAHTCWFCAVSTHLSPTGVSPSTLETSCL